MALLRRLLNTWQPSVYCCVHETLSQFAGVFDALPVSVTAHVCNYKFAMASEEVGSVLRFLHDVGLALYYENMIKDWVFLNPAFITRRIANVIKEGHKGQQTRRNQAIKSDLDPLWSRLHRDGFLDMKLLNFLWSDGYEEHVPRAVIVKLLCHFGVFVDVSNGVGGEELLEAGTRPKGQLSESKVRILREIIPAVHFDPFLQKIRDCIKGTQVTDHSHRKHLKLTNNTWSCVPLSELTQDLQCPRVVLVPALLRHEDDFLAKLSWMPW